MSAPTADEFQPWAACRETHLSAVFMLGEVVLKFKKPIRTDFVDYTTRAAREDACEAEVRLNQRLSPDVYHFVRHIDLGVRLPEPVVVMRRLHDEDQLPVRLARDPENSGADLRAVARCLADFHERAERRIDLDHPSGATALMDAWNLECDEIDVFGDRAGTAEQRRMVRELGNNFLAGRGALFDARVEDGKIRDGHGDLRAEHVYLIDQGVRIIDCLEFSDDLRTCDVLADVAFLVMDLERLGFDDAARELIDDYAEFSADAFPASLLHFYIAQRALVRAKVAALRARQGATPDADPAVLLSIAIEHLVHAVPYVVLIGGLPGAGKSAIGGALARLRGAVYLSSDEIRHERQAGCNQAGDHPGWETGPYSPAETEEVYAELMRRAGWALGAGYPVVLDASWRDVSHRSAAHELAARSAVAVIDVLCQIDEPTGLARVRGNREGFSQAGAATRTKMRVAFDDWPGARIVTTDLPIMEAAGELLPVIDRAVRAYSRLCRATSWASTAACVRRSNPSFASTFET